MKIILAFDSFKGSLSAEEAVAAAREGVNTAFPDAELIGLSLADGGEGTAAALGRFLKAEWVSCEVCDPLFRKIEARYAITGNIAIMEMASAAGLTLLNDEGRNPLKTSTFGVGEMMLDAIRRGCTKILIGIGGSATCDGGIGMLAALGAKFEDENGELLPPIGENLSLVKHADLNFDVDLKDVSIDVVCDVENPLFGKNGAAYIFAPQKGANPAEVEILDHGLRHFANICKQSPADTPGCGAAGGLGFGLLLIGANLRRGVDVILDAANLDSHLKNADLMITGEGKIDRQTLCGKLPFGVMQRAKALGVPTVALAGKVEDENILLRAGFHSVGTINPPNISHKEAMKTETAKQNLKEKSYELTRTFFAKYI